MASLNIDGTVATHGAMFEESGLRLLGFGVAWVGPGEGSNADF